MGDKTNKTIFNKRRTAVTRGRRLPWALLCAPLLAGVAGEALAGFVAYSAAGQTPADITPTRDAFRAAIGGGTTSAANGDFGGVRREINWDGVPDARSDPNLLPGNFFNVNSPRGAVFSTPGSGFLVSANSGAGQAILFGFPNDLQTFSAQRLFAQVGSNILDINFFLPGTSTTATTSAFGAVFVDVEDNNSVNATMLEFFDAAGARIFSQTAAAAGNQGLSFLGGVADAGERIGRVRITTPNNFLISNGVRDNEQIDFVVMDDFIYATPGVLPLPGSLGLSLIGLALLGWRQRVAQA